jgi:hypothetical protein
MLSSLLLYVAAGLMGFGVVRRQRPGRRGALVVGGLLAGIAVALPAPSRSFEYSPGEADCRNPKGPLSATWRGISAPPD